MDVSAVLGFLHFTISVFQFVPVTDGVLQYISGYNSDAIQVAALVRRSVISITYAKAR